ncbi:hypothetical protein [Streptomyces sp. NPDC008001]
MGMTSAAEVEPSGKGLKEDTRLTGVWIWDGNIVKVELLDPKGAIFYVNI